MTHALRSRTRAHARSGRHLLPLRAEGGARARRRGGALAVLGLGLLALGCSVSAPKPAGPESLVGPDAAVFDQSLRGIDPDELDLSRFWTEARPDPTRAPVALDHRTFSTVADQVKDGVVNIYTRKLAERELRFGIHPNDLLPFRLPVVSSILDIIPFQIPIPFRDEAYSLGSGFIINREGYILTNAHVVQNATDIRVVLAEGTREYVAQIVGSDRVTDTALLRFQPDAPVTTLPLGDSEDVGVGEVVVAVGNPLGLRHTVTSGVVSAKERVVPGDKSQLLDFLQTDSAINPGSSGGPLLNLYGEVVGVNTAIVDRAQNIGFAIPINTVKRVMELLILGQEQRGWLGIQAAPLLPERADALGVARGVQGAVVEAVEQGSPAAQAGVRRDDLIVAIDGVPIGGLLTLRRESLGLLADQEVQLSLLRGGERLEVRPKLVRQPGDR